MSFTTWDIETTIRQSFKRKANPFDPLNFVVASGWKRKDGEPQSDYFGRGKRPFDWFTKILTGTTILVGMNIKFDLLYATREPQNLEAYMDWVAKGGIVWDVQLAEYLLNGMAMEDQFLSMDEIAPRYGGNLKFDEVKALWQAGVDTPDIDEDLLTRYLIGNGTEHGDIGNTELIFVKQLARAREAKQVKSILMNMGSLLCTIEMERNGMRVDEVLGAQHAAALNAKLTEIKAGLDAFLPADMPPEIAFKWTNRYHLSPLIFGGEIKYEKPVHQKDEQGNLLYAKKKCTHYVLEDGGTYNKEYYTLELNAGTPDLPAIAYYAGGKNAGEPKTKQVDENDLDKPKTKITEFRYKLPRMTEPKKSWASSTPGLFSVASDVIDELGSRDIPFLKALGLVQSLAKDVSTYYVSIDEKTGKQKGMLTLVDNGIIHHSINHVNTVTGRFSSSDPNLQNIPKGGEVKEGVHKSQVKLVFISRFKDGVICQSDFTALEVYVQAILTKCQQLIDDLKAGLDMHCVRVAAKEKISYELALERCKGNKDKGIKAIPEWDVKRTEAKVFSFQRAYGAGAQKISDSTGIAIEDVKDLIAAEELRYPETPAYYIRLTMEIQTNRKPTSMFIAHPEAPHITCQLGKSYSRTPDNKLYSYRESPTPKFLLEKTGQTQGFSPTEIKNYVVQGTGGEWAKAAMWLAVRAFYARRNFGHLALLVNQVHDALYGDFDPTVKDDASALLHACMESASDFMEYYFDWKVPVPVPSVTECGPNMMEADEMVGDEWRAKARAFRLELRKLYMNNYIPSFEKETQ